MKYTKNQALLAMILSNTYNRVPRLFAQKLAVTRVAVELLTNIMLLV